VAFDKVLAISSVPAAETSIINIINGVVFQVVECVGCVGTLLVC
jgi:hypothetical protein